MSGTIVPQASSGSGSAFVQQGSLDYVALSKSTLTFSVEILSRFSKAGVEMITVAMGQAMSSRFRVPPEGQKNIADAVSNFKAYPSLSKVLWFGFGIKHVVRLLCETEQGTTCAALCACLSVSYSPEYGANVLSELCKDLGSDDNLNPSLSQWYNLMDVCAGALDSSSFPGMVNMFCRLGNTKVQEKERFVKATAPEALATAIKMLSDVSQGRISTVELRGGLDCGWIAAFARFVLCLRVTVTNENGECLYQYRSHDNMLPQINLVFDLSQSGDLVPKRDLQIVKRTLRLPYNGSFPFQTASKSCELFCPGRSSWSTILVDTFGSIIERLLSPALVYPFIADLETLVEHQLRAEVRLWLFPFHASRQERSRCFFADISKLFPELQSLREEVQALETARVHEAVSTYGGLEPHCKCGICDHTIRDSQQRADFTGFCLPTVSRSIFEMFCLLLGLDIDEALRPAANGLPALYHEIYNVYEDSRPLPAWVLLRDMDLARELSFTRPHELTYTLTLFSGRLITESFSRSIAESHDGVCFYDPALEDPTYPPTEQLRRRVISGNIELRGRLYKKVLDSSYEESGSSAYTHDDESLLNLSSIANVYTLKSLPKLTVRETCDSSSLEAWIAVESPNESREESDYHSACITLDVASHKSASLPAQVINIGGTFGSLGCHLRYRPCNLLIPIAMASIGYPFTSALKPATPDHRLQPRLSRHSEGRPNLPQPGEWVLLTRTTSPFGYTLEVLRGDFLLLYLSMLAPQARNDRDARNSRKRVGIFDVIQKIRPHKGFRPLVRSNGCLSCLASDGDESKESDEFLARRIVIHSIDDTREEVQEFIWDPIVGNN